MESWLTEVIELHEFFERYFLGTLPVDDLERVELYLADDFTMLGPDGALANKEQIVDSIRRGYGHANSLKIAITEPTLIHESDDAVVARYIENHELADTSNHRWATVTFRKDPSRSNGLQWLAVQETWVDGTRE